MVVEKTVPVLVGASRTPDPESHRNAEVPFKR